MQCRYERTAVPNHEQSNPKSDKADGMRSLRVSPLGAMCGVSRRATFGAAWRRRVSGHTRQAPGRAASGERRVGSRVRWEAASRPSGSCEKANGRTTGSWGERRYHSAPIPESSPFVNEVERTGFFELPKYLVPRAAWRYRDFECFKQEPSGRSARHDKQEWSP